MHRDIKPENILYRTPAEDANIVLVDFGIAAHLRGGDGESLDGLCGSIGYAAPEVIARKGHGKPVDMWGLGVVAYAMLCGYTPFSSADPALFREQVKEGHIAFHEKYWTSVSPEAIDFVKRCLTLDPSKRHTADEAMQHPWFNTSMERSDARDLSAGLRENYRAKWRTAINAVRATHKLNLVAESAQAPDAPRDPPSPLFSDEDEPMPADVRADAAASPQETPSERGHMRNGSWGWNNLVSRFQSIYQPTADP